MKIKTAMYLILSVSAINVIIALINLSHTRMIEASVSSWAAGFCFGVAMTLLHEIYHKRP